MKFLHSCLGTSKSKYKKIKKTIETGKRAFVACLRFFGYLIVLVKKTTDFEQVNYGILVIVLQLAVAFNSYRVPTVGPAQIVAFV